MLRSRLAGRRRRVLLMLLCGRGTARDSGSRNGRLHRKDARRAELRRFRGQLRMDRGGCCRRSGRRRRVRRRDRYPRSSGCSRGDSSSSRWCVCGSLFRRRHVRGVVYLRVRRRVHAMPAPRPRVCINRHQHRRGREERSHQRLARAELGRCRRRAEQRRRRRAHRSQQRRRHLRRRCRCRRLLECLLRRQARCPCCFLLERLEVADLRHGEHAAEGLRQLNEQRIHSATLRRGRRVI